MSFTEAVQSALTKNYANFSGRAQRSEYWWFLLFYLLVTIVVTIVDVVISSVIGFSFLGLLVALGLVVPAWAVSIRRLHDTGRSAWWVLIGIIPLIGSLVLIVFMFLDSEPGNNRYGANPKGNYWTLGYGVPSR